VNAFIAVGSAALMVMVATGIVNLQWWLERSDFEHHFED
jgi:hypothetical protein